MGYQHTGAVMTAVMTAAFCLARPEESKRTWGSHPDLGKAERRDFSVTAARPLKGQEVVGRWDRILPIMDPKAG